MGWWSAEILGGDSALDAVGEFEHEIGWNYDWDGFIYKPNSQSKAQTVLKKASSKAAALKLFQEYSAEEVLAILEVFLINDVKITKAMAEAGRNAVATDQWGLEGDEERQDVLEDFRVRMEANAGGKPVKDEVYEIHLKETVEHEGIFTVTARSPFDAQEKARKMAEAAKTVKGRFNAYDKVTKRDVWYTSPHGRPSRVVCTTKIGTPSPK